MTTTPTQSLLMINGRWPLERAKGFAARLQREHPGKPNEQITRAFQLTYGRNTSDAERKKVQQLVFAPTPNAPVANEISWSRRGRDRSSGSG